MSGPVVFRDATVLMGEELLPLPRAYIAVEDGIIVDIGTGPAPRGEDLAGAAVMPAFVDAHTHLADAGFKDGAVGLPTEEAVSPPHGLKYRYLAGLSPRELVRVLRGASPSSAATGSGPSAISARAGRRGRRPCGRPWTGSSSREWCSPNPSPHRDTRGSPTRCGSWQPYPR